jgi:hypothetical protein
MTFLKKQEAASKISLLHEPFLHSGQFNHEASGSGEPNFTIPTTNTNLEPRFVYTEHPNSFTTMPKPQSPNQPNPQPPHHIPTAQTTHSNTRNPTNQFSLAIA